MQFQTVQNAGHNAPIRVATWQSRGSPLEVAWIGEWAQRVERVDGDGL